MSTEFWEMSNMVQLLYSPNMTHITDAETEAQRGKTAGIQGQSVLTPEHVPLTLNLTPIKALLYKMAK